MKKLITLLLPSLFAVSSGALLVGCTGKPTENAAAPVASSIPTLVSTSKAPKTPFLAADEAVRSKVAGRVWEVFFASGDHVQKDQVLLKLAVPLPNPARQHLQALYQQRQQQYNSLSASHLQHPSSASRARLDSVQLRLQEVKQRLQQLTPQLGFVYVAAPKEGFITDKTVVAGDYLVIGSAVATLASAPATVPNVLFSSAD
ncbi:efflux RND transporter periplasmic adaptor subunit [Hymenobacter sp. BT491]|uniref:efflux RND transporter periplasmic adaptor subunit n=1 Tax=Hymenobacter sp. BT491 TaxID=2766779 RepID=UPI001653E287|nr:efflux RND transporter periplasmic adaptor subunit [Hymenobacter sp. BT491]MBC6991910.1 efflux RND transporter periplasmic adaptor subunit [Hymenobacter sp. BT491]